jgi:hypothetical protein
VGNIEAKRSISTLEEEKKEGNYLRKRSKSVTEEEVSMAPASNQEFSKPQSSMINPLLTVSKKKKGSDLFN